LRLRKGAGDIFTEIGLAICDLEFGVWNLGFGIWDFSHLVVCSSKTKKNKAENGH